ncbi:MAG: hypothetical protein ACRDRI_14250 [Pseudonocardiaceae bacterium]
MRGDARSPRTLTGDQAGWLLSRLPRVFVRRMVTVSLTMAGAPPFVRIGLS